MKIKNTFLRASLFAIYSIAIINSVCADLPRESLFYDADLENVSVTLGFDREERLIRQTLGGSATEMFKADSGYVVLGYDVNPWMMVSVGAGQSKIKPDSDRSSLDDNDQKGMWMMGLQANIWQTDIFEPDYLTSRCRLQSSFSFWKRDSTVYGNSVSWDEVRADFLFSIESFVSGLGEDKSETPYSLILFAGAVYSSYSLEGATDISYSPDVTFEELESTGLIAGAKFKLHHKLWLGYEARVYEETSHSASLTYHF